MQKSLEFVKIGKPTNKSSKSIIRYKRVTNKDIVVKCKCCGDYFIKTIEMQKKWNEMGDKDKNMCGYCNYSGNNVNDYERWVPDCWNEDDDIDDIDMDDYEDSDGEYWCFPRSYSSKNNGQYLITTKNGLHTDIKMGMELELPFENIYDRSDFIREIIRFSGNTERWICKSDCSIPMKGVEVVSTPMDYSILRQFEIEKILNDFRYAIYNNTGEEGYDDYSLKDCGIHIHVSRQDLIRWLLFDKNRTEKNRTIEKYLFVRNINEYTNKKEYDFKHEVEIVLSKFLQMYIIKCYNTLSKQNDNLIEFYGRDSLYGGDLEIKSITNKIRRKEVLKTFDRCYTRIRRIIYKGESLDCLIDICRIILKEWSLLQIKIDEITNEDIKYYRKKEKQVFKECINDLKEKKNRFDRLKVIKRWDIEGLVRPLYKQKINDSRYVQINVQNKHTIEFRGFAATIEPDLVKDRIDKVMWVLEESIKKEK